MLSKFTQRVAASLGRHFVTLSCQQYLPGIEQPKTLVFSGFVVEILHEWFYLTAGHILEDVRAAKRAGARFDAWRFGDQLAGNAFNGAAVPYEFDDDKWLAFDDRSAGIDYAAGHIPHFYRRQLEVGGVVAIDRSAWSNHVTASDHWALVGVPSESVEYDGKTVITARVILVPLVPTAEPAAAGAKAENQFYAKPAEDSGLYFQNPDGFSGAPVFSLTHVGEQWLYNVIGVQSAWYESSGTLAVCPFTSFAQAIEDVLTEAMKSVGNATTDASAA
jgi:hypothetical protein